MWLLWLKLALRWRFNQALASRRVSEMPNMRRSERLHSAIAGAIVFSADVVLQVRSLGANLASWKTGS